MAKYYLHLDFSFGLIMYMLPVLSNLSHSTTCVPPPPPQPFKNRLTLPVSSVFLTFRIVFVIVREQQPFPFVAVHPNSFWAAISSSGHPN